MGLGLWHAPRWARRTPTADSDSRRCNLPFSRRLRVARLASRARTRAMPRPWRVCSRHGCVRHALRVATARGGPMRGETCIAEGREAGVLVCRVQRVGGTAAAQLVRSHVVLVGQQRTPHVRARKHTHVQLGQQGRVRRRDVLHRLVRIQLAPKSAAADDELLVVVRVLPVPLDVTPAGLLPDKSSLCRPDSCSKSGERPRLNICVVPPRMPLG